MTHDRTPVRWATYPGDCRGILDEGAKRPNTIGELLYPVTADFDGEHTRVGFSYMTPAEVSS
jgi:hypothetical protein